MCRPVQLGDIIRITEAYKQRHQDADSRALKTWSCHVTGVERGTHHTGREGWWITLVPCSESDSIQCAWGRQHLPDTPGEWGVQSFEVLRNSRLAIVEIYRPQPGDRGYDSLC